MLEFFRFREDPFNSNAGRQALMKASEEQASMRKAVGKIGVDGKMEEGAGGETPGMRGYQFVGTPSMTPGWSMNLFFYYFHRYFILLKTSLSLKKSS